MHHLLWLSPLRELSALPTEGGTSNATVYFFMLLFGFVPCLISFYPSAPLGVLLSIETKVPKSSLFDTPHLETEFSFCGGKRKISASDAAKVRKFFARVLVRENPLEFKTFG